MRLVQSLIVSDLLMGIVGLVGCIQQLSGNELKKDSVECDGLGVSFVAIIFSQHLWTLSLAFTTFMILLHPLSSITIFLEKYWYWNWPIVWAISFAISVVGYVLYGYGPTGGICYYQDDSGLFGELIQFLPRAIVFVVIAGLYGKLYVFLKRPDKIRTGFSHDSGSSWSKGMKGSWLPGHGHGHGSQHRSRRKRFFTKQHKTIIVDHHSHHSHDQSQHSTATDCPRRGDSKSAPPDHKRHHHFHMPHLPHFNPHLLHRKSVVEDDDVPPWERVELPPFQVDGQRYGGSEKGEHRQNSLLGGLIRRPNTAPSSFSNPGRVLSQQPAFLSPTNTLHEEAEEEHEHEREERKKQGEQEQHSEKNDSEKKDNNEKHESEAKDGNDQKDTSNEADGSSEKTQARTQDAENSPRQLHAAVTEENKVHRAISGTSDGTTAVDLDSPSRRNFAPCVASVPSTPRTLVQPPCEPSSCEILCPKPMLLPNPEENSSVVDLEKGLAQVSSPGEMDDEEDDMDLLAMLRSDGAGRDATASHHSSEYIQESMSSYLNRKTALLMLWFPLGYVLLFGISTIRIIYDFVGNPPTGLRAMSRWMIFGQGLLNLVIYGLVEFHTKRVVRRRVRRGTLNHHTSGRHSSGIGSGIPGFPGLRWPKRSGTALSQSHHGHGQSHSRADQIKSNGSRTATGSRTGNKSPQVSFVDPEMSILQRLDEEMQFPAVPPRGEQRGE